MRKFSNHIREIVDHSGFKLNTISKISGVSHSYLTKLMRDEINRPGKDKVASILFALNFSVPEIDKVLVHYDYQPLSRPDIPGILRNNWKRKIEGTLLPLYDNMHTRMLLAPMERLGGTKILIKANPSVLFMPEALYLSDESDPETADSAWDFQLAFKKALFRERKENFIRSCMTGGRSETYICRKCLTQYLERQLEGKVDPELVVRYFANCISVLLTYSELHRISITGYCSHFDYQIQGSDMPNPKVFFFARKTHSGHNIHEMVNLNGFVSDSPAVIALFQKETDLCRQSVDQRLEADYPQGLIQLLFTLFQDKGLGAALTAWVKNNATDRRLSYLNEAG